jgi:hypothetical protein
MTGKMGQSRFNRAVVICLFLSVLAVFVSYFCNLGDAVITVWGDRDLWRALTVPEQWPGLGPETNGGVQTPGGLFYLLLAGVLAIRPDIIGANFAVIALYAASTALLAAVFWKEISPLAGALTAAAFAGSGVLAQTITVWNPGYLLPLATLVTVCGYHFVKGGRAFDLFLTTVALAIGLQIHLQIFEVAVGLAVATLLLRPKLSWRHGLALVAGFVLPYLPTLDRGSFSALGAAASLPDDAYRAYAFWGFDALQKLKLALDLFGASTEAFAIRAGTNLAWTEAALSASDLIALLLALAMGIRAFRHRRSADAALAVFPIIVVVCLAFSLSSFVNIRHIVAAVPAAAIMVGLGAEQAMRRLLAGRRLGVGVAALLAAAIALRPAALAYAGLFDKPFLPDSVAAQTEIAATLKSRFYADHETFESHTALFQRYMRPGWQLVQGGVGHHMAFIYRTTRSAATPTNRQDCVAILPKAGIKGDPAAELAASPAFAALAPSFTQDAAESPHFLYLPYATREGNCLKTFPNPYIQSRFEQAYLAPSSSRLPPPGTAVFPVVEAAQSFPLGIELRREGDRYVAVLHGRLLRGYTGLYFRTIADPVLCFAGDAGARSVSFANVTVGSLQTGTLVPWRSAPFELPDGRFELWLTGLDARRMKGIQLDLGTLSMPEMGVRLAEGPRQTALPAACPKPARRP